MTHCGKCGNYAEKITVGDKTYYICPHCGHWDEVEENTCHSPSDTPHPTP